MSVHPGLRIVEGPVVAGLGPGDAIAVEPDGWGFFSSHYGGAGVSVPNISSSWNAKTNGSAHRFHDREWQEIHYGGRSNNPDARWEPVKARTLKVGPWLMELVDDLPLLTQVRRFDDVVAVRPGRVWMSNRGMASHWTSVDNSTGGVILGELFVIDPFRSASVVGPQIHRLPRSRGLPTYAVRAGEDGGRMDPAIARAVVEQFASPQGSAIICFDGVVRVYPSVDPPGTHWFNQWQPYEAMTGQALADAPPAASLDEVAAFARARLPEEWALEQALLEECGLLSINQ
ncbi:MAG: hypothetical protein Q8O67_28680 [Deltaproteobacteria bacterium]|nr:hypothetical protein [Deltaproteobacteria bacterium]